MPPIPGVWQWHSLVARHAKSLREAANRIAKALDSQLKQTTPQSTQQLETVLVRNTPKQPLHPLARIRQSQARWYSTARRALNDAAGSRSFSSSAGQRGAKVDRLVFRATSQVGSHISQSTGRAPFASTLRPNLTGGTLGRTAGGYGLSGSGRIGGARHFSHAPAAQAQVVQNVSQAMRAFLTQGQKAQYDGVGPRGGKRYKAVSNLQAETSRKLRSLPKATPGSRIEFAVNPTITALTPLAGLAGYSAESSDDFCSMMHLNTSGLLNVLSVDFSRSLSDLAAVMADLQRLSALGDLPITYTGTSLVVHFPGCDADSVDRLCDELGVLRGSIVQDADFDDFAGTEIALLFPFAPSEEGSEVGGEELFDPPPPAYFQAATKTKTPLMPDAARQVISLDDMFSSSNSDDAYSTQSDTGFETPEDLVILESPEVASPWHTSSPFAYGSARSGSQGSSADDPLEYQGFEGIYRFLGELEAVRR